VREWLGGHPAATQGRTSATPFSHTVSRESPAGHQAQLKDSWLVLDPTAVNAKHVLTRLLVQVRVQTVSQVSSTRLMKSNTQPDCGTPFLRLLFISGFKWNLNVCIKDTDIIKY